MHYALGFAIRFQRHLVPLSLDTAGQEEAHRDSGRRVETTSGSPILDTRELGHTCARQHLQWSRSRSSPPPGCRQSVAKYRLSGPTRLAGSIS